MPRTTIELGDLDCAIIIREDGSWETLIGHPDNDEDAEVSQGALIATALTLVLNNEDMVHELIGQVEASGAAEDIVDAANEQKSN